MKLNEKIAWYRRDRRLSQEELAARVGVSRQAVSKWELGEASPDVNKLLALSRAFGVTTDHLLNDSEEPERSAPPPREPAAPAAPPQQDRFSDLPGFIGRMARRWGWLAGIYIALEGAGMALVGGIARWGFGSMFSSSHQMMNSFGTVGGGWAYSGPPELEEAIMEELGIAQASPLSGVESFFLGFATLIMVIGIVVAIAGLILAYALWKKGQRGGSTPRATEN